MKTVKRTKILPDRVFHKLWDESVKSEDCNSFIKMLSNPMSDKYIDFKQKYDIDIVTTTYLLNCIYEMSHMEFRNVIDLAGKGQAEISHIFCIPIRTVQDWYAGKNRCPSYMILAMLKQFHLFRLSKYVKLQSEIDYNNTKPSVYKKKQETGEIKSSNQKKGQEELSFESTVRANERENRVEELETEIDDEDLWFLDRLNSIPDSTEEVDRLIKQEVENETVKDLLKRTAYLDRLIRDK